VFKTCFYNWLSLFTLIYIQACGRCAKQVNSRYTFYQYKYSLGIETVTLALLAVELQEHI